MHVVVILGWREETVELVQALAAVLGIMPYEMRQRLIGGGPTVVANFADQQSAGAMAAKLSQCGVKTLVVDAEATRGKNRLFVRRFEIKEWALHVEANDGESVDISYGDIDLLLPGTRIMGQSETKTVTERKFSLGRTILSGGIPLTKTIERQEEVSTETRENILYLYAGERPAIIFTQGGLTYYGLGSAMQLSRELNFAYLKSELRRLCPAADHDDRLLNRLGQARLLGPALNPETNMDLAFHILALCLRRGRMVASY